VRGGATNKGNKNNMPMKINLRKPCSQCPFRRNSLRGWLGPWDVEQLLHHLGRGEFPCHQTIKRDDQSIANRMLQPAGRERKRTGKRPGRWREAAPARSQKVSR
jgi:hypothetical protein